METDLLTAFVNNYLDEEIWNLEVVISDVIVLRSERGRLFTTPHHKLLLEFQGPPVAGRFPTDPLTYSDGMTIRGITNQGWSFSTFLFVISPTSYSPKIELLDWKAEIIECFLQRGIDNNAGSLEYNGVVDHLDCLFEEGTSTVIKEGMPPNVSLDWLELPSPKSSIVVRRGGLDWSDVRIVMKDSTVADLESEVKTFLNALSVRMGRRIDGLAARSITSNVEQLCFSGFNMNRSRHSGFFPLVPLNLRNKGGSIFLRTAHEFFKQQNNERIMDTLFSVWDAETVSRDNHRLQVAIAVDGLSAYVNKLRKGSVETEAEKTRVEEEGEFDKLKEIVFQFLDTVEWKQGHLSRMRALIQRSELNDASPRIKAAGQALGIEFTDVELRYWRKMRHPAAHGNKVEYSPNEEDFFACLSMLHRMILSLIGWVGPRMHYGLDSASPVRADLMEKPVQIFKLSELDEFKVVERKWPPQK